MRLAGVALVIAGCFWEPARPGGAGMDAHAMDSHSADVPADACTRGTWGTPRKLVELGTLGYDEYGPYLSPDGTTLWYSTPAGYYMATRQTRGDGFNPAVSVPVGSAHPTSKEVFLSDDQQRIWFSEYNVNGSSDLAHHVFTATRLGATQFGAETELAMSVGSTTDELAPALTSDERTMVVTIDNGTDSLYLAERGSGSNDFPRPTTQIDLGAVTNNSCCAWLSGDGLAMYFTHHLSQTMNEIRWAKRADRSAAFIEQGVVPIPADGRTGRAAPGLTRDELVMVYAADGSDSDGPDLYLTERSCN